MVGLGGLEPPTSPLSGVRSNHLSYRPGKFFWRVRTWMCGLFRKDPDNQLPGGACRDRTDDPLLAKQVLSQLS